MRGSAATALYVALFFSVCCEVRVSASAWLSWTLGCWTCSSFVALLRGGDGAVWLLSERRRARLAPLAAAALLAFGLALLARKARPFLFVFFALLAYDTTVWTLVLSALEEDAAISTLPLSRSFLGARRAAEALLFGFAAVAYLAPVFPLAPPLLLSLRPSAAAWLRGGALPALCALHFALLRLEEHEETTTTTTEATASSSSSSSSFSGVVRVVLWLLSALLALLGALLVPGAAPEALASVLLLPVAALLARPQRAAQLLLALAALHVWRHGVALLPVAAFLAAWHELTQ